MSEAASVKLEWLSWLNALPEEEALHEFLRCCGSTHWARAMAKRRPYESEQAVYIAANDVWNEASAVEENILEALSHHPKIGDLDHLRQKFASTSRWAEGEQSGVKQASEVVLKKLHSGNEEYERKFGFIFVVFATGKTAEQMLYLLEERLPHDRESELRIAAEEQRKITHNRLEKLWQQQQQ